MKYKNLTFEEAFELVKSKRTCAEPNDGFLLTLQKYEKELLDKRDLTEEDNKNNDNINLCKKEKEIFIENKIKIDI